VPNSSRSSRGRDPKRVRPEDIGLGASDRRRTPGLRGEEIALLAGISAGHYMRS
jgi:hypothetical protein